MIIRRYENCNYKLWKRKGKEDIMDDKAGYGISLFGMLTIAFIALKFCGIIKWSWIWVFSPIWIPAAIATSIILIVVVIPLVVSIVISTIFRK